MKLVLALQYNPSDATQAMRLAKLIADIEPAPRQDVEFVFVRRFDTDPVPVDVAAHVAGKFLLSGHKTRTQWTGWPGGCNAMAKDFLWSMLPIAHDLGSCGILLIEPDCVPLQRDWLNQIINAWMLAMLDGAWLMGSWRNSGGEFGHINGVACYRADFASLVDLSRITPDLAWDCAIVPQVRKKWCVSGLFLNRFQETNATEEILRTPETGGVPPCIVHGFKDRSAEDIARRWMGV